MRYSAACGDCAAFRYSAAYGDCAALRNNSAWGHCAASEHCAECRHAHFGSAAPIERMARVGRVARLGRVAWRLRRCLRSGGVGAPAAGERASPYGTRVQLRRIRSTGTPQTPPRGKKKGPRWAGALLNDAMVGVTGFEPAASSSRTTRATKLRHTPLQLEKSTLPRAMLRTTRTFGRAALCGPVARPPRSASDDSGRRLAPGGPPPAVVRGAGCDAGARTPRRRPRVPLPSS